MEAQKTEAEKIIELLISEGKITQDELDSMIAAEREQSPLLPLQEDVGSLQLGNEVTMMALADSYENQVISDMARQEEAAIGMTATVELYETIMFLEMRIAQLEEGGE